VASPRRATSQGHQSVVLTMLNQIVIAAAFILIPGFGVRSGRAIQVMIGSYINLAPRMNIWPTTIRNVADPDQIRAAMRFIKCSSAVRAIRS
jgi:hypothetical protein